MGRNTKGLELNLKTELTPSSVYEGFPCVTCVNIPRVYTGLEKEISYYAQHKQKQVVGERY